MSTAQLMRAAYATHAADPSQLEVVVIPRPKPSGDSLLVRIRAAGINRSDALACRGVIPGPFPRVLGRDFAGHVVEGPSNWLGRRVWGTGGGELGLARDGTHCEFVEIPVDSACDIPPGLTYADAAASALAYFTASTAWDVAGGVDASMTVVITGALGCVGNASAAIAKHRGARTIGIVRAESFERAVADASIDVVVRADVDKLSDEVLEATEGAGAERLVDTVGNSIGVATLKGLAVHAGACVLSSSPGMPVALDLVDFYRREVRWCGLHTGRYGLRDAAGVLASMGDGFSNGSLPPTRIEGLYRLDDIAKAYARAEVGGVGRPVVMPVDADIEQAHLHEEEQ